jgi:ribonuclease HI
VVHEITVISDGSCPLGNLGPGGWASIIRWKTEEIVVTGSHPATTNNRAELMAAIEALRALKRPCRVELHTDSMYLRQGMAEWLPKWRLNNWRTASGKPVLNQDLWRQLEQLVEQHEVHWSWTVGHAADNPDQNRADTLARKAAQEQGEALGRR